MKDFFIETKEINLVNANAFSKFIIRNSSMEKSKNNIAYSFAIIFPSILVCFLMKWHIFSLALLSMAIFMFTISILHNSFITKFIFSSVNISPGQKLYALSYTDIIEVKIVDYYNDSQSGNIVYRCKYISPITNEIKYRYFSREELFCNINTAKKQQYITFKKRIDAFKKVITNSSSEIATNFLTSKEFTNLANDKFDEENTMIFRQERNALIRYTTVDGMLDLLNVVQNKRDFICEQELSKRNKIEALNERWK